jgi:hypothetical protein
MFIMFSLAPSAYMTAAAAASHLAMRNLGPSSRFWNTTAMPSLPLRRDQEIQSFARKPQLMTHP